MHAAGVKLVAGSDVALALSRPEATCREIVLLARAMLRDPYWPLHAAEQLGVKIDYWPQQYGRAR